MCFIKCSLNHFTPRWLRIWDINVLLRDYFGGKKWTNRTNLSMQSSFTWVQYSSFELGDMDSSIVVFTLARAAILWSFDQAWCCNFFMRLCSTWTMISTSNITIKHGTCYTHEAFLKMITIKPLVKLLVPSMVKLSMIWKICYPHNLLNHHLRK